MTTSREFVEAKIKREPDITSDFRILFVDYFVKANIRQGKPTGNQILQMIFGSCLWILGADEYYS